MRRRAGLSIIEVLVVIAVIGLLLALLIPAIMYGREAARLRFCGNNMRQIGIATEAYDSAYGCFPIGLVTSFVVGPWNEKVQLLPFLDERDFHNSINFRLRAENPANETIRRTNLTKFLCPSDFGKSPNGDGMSNYPYCGGSGALNRPRPPAYMPCDGIGGGWPVVKRSDCIDGLSHTATHSEQVRGSATHYSLTRVQLGAKYEIEASSQQQLLEDCEHLNNVSDASRVGVPWHYPIRYTHLWPPGIHSCMGIGAIVGDCTSPITANSRHTNAVNLLFGDGHVQTVANTIDVSVWRALGSRRGGEQIDF